jgi:hypothetical protein
MTDGLLFTDSESVICIKGAPSHAGQPHIIFVGGWKMGLLDRGEAVTKTQIATGANLLKMDVFLFFPLSSRVQSCDRIVACGASAITR